MGRNAVEWKPRDRLPPVRDAMSRVQSFPPIVSQESKALILGSMPGEASLKAGQYYAHPRNAFWQIMSELFGAGLSLPYEERVALLRSAGIALWDTLQACVRPGSWMHQSLRKRPTTSRPFSVITRTSRMCFSMAAEPKRFFAVTSCRRWPNADTPSLDCHRPALPMPRWHWSAK
jgi:hypoxanthine-DNA glycosylase